MPKKRTKPKKPYPGFPLYAHAGGVWAKKIRGQVFYFGPWNNWRAALASFEAKREALYGGRTPCPDRLTVANLLDQFLGGKNAQLQTDEISKETYGEYETTCIVIDSHFGKNRPLESLTVEDLQNLRLALSKGACKCQGSYQLATLQRKLDKSEFQALRAAIVESGSFKSSIGRITLADPETGLYGKWKDIKRIQLNVTNGKCRCENRLGPVSLKRRLTIARMIFASQPLEFRKALRSPSSKVIRAESRKRGKRFYKASDIRKLVQAADPHLRAMILLGINCGFGPKDCCAFPSEHVNLQIGWHTFHRPKTEIDRRCKLWPETIKAVKAVAEKPYIFNGRKWNRFAIASEFEKLCKTCSVKNLGFYSLRRTFETIAGASGVQQFVINEIMGHSRPNDMASIYRQKVFDNLLQKCTSFVREWYLGKMVIR